MTIEELINKIRKDIESLNNDEKEATLNFLKIIIKKIRDSGFQDLTSEECELTSIVLKQEKIKNSKSSLFLTGFQAVVSELAKQNNADKKPSSNDWKLLGVEIEIDKLYQIFTDKIAEKQLSFDQPNKNDPQTAVAREIDLGSAAETPRNADKDDDARPVSPPSLPAKTTIATTSTTSNASKITAQTILETLWGDTNKNNPTADSVCGKILKQWNEKQRSPALIPPPEFIFVKPALENIIVKDNGKNIKMNLVAIHRAKTDVKLILSRDLDDEKNLATWTCQSTDNLISEKMQFELIAAEAFALRKAQGIENAGIIGIMPLEEDGKSKNESTQFCQQNGEQMLLSVREEALIEAHIKAGFTVTYGKYEIKEIKIGNAAQLPAP